MRKLSCFFCLFLLCALLASEALSRQVQVWHVSAAHGSDENPGSQAKPLCSIAAALERAQPGDVVELAEGIYRETVKFVRSGEPERPIVLRGSKNARGELLSTIDPGVMLDPSAWQREEEIGPDVYLYTGELPFALSQVVVDHKLIAPIYHRADHVQGSERRYSAWEVLAWPRDHHVPIVGIDGGLPFWETIGAVYYLAEDAEASYGERLYLRFENGANPAELDVLVYPARATVWLDDVGFIVVQGLNIAASTEGVKISGSRAVMNTVENCYIYYGTERLLVTGGVSGVEILNNTFAMRFYGAPTGAWAGGGSDPVAAAKRFVYAYYKYWASRHSISNDRSVSLHSCRDVTIANNCFDGGLIGISLIRTDRVQIEHNCISNHSSVGVVVRDHNSDTYIDSNRLENNSIQVRLHLLNYGWHRGIYVVRNLSILPKSLGSHVFSHVRADLPPIREEQSPEIYLLHNSFIGGYRGIGLPNARTVENAVPELFIINNLFAVNGHVIGGLRAYLSQGITIGAFDYNLILEDPDFPTTTAPWFGEHVRIESSEALTDDYVPVSELQLESAAHLGEISVLAGRRADAFSFITNDYYPGKSPDIGAIQTQSSE